MKKILGLSLSLILLLQTFLFSPVSSFAQATCQLSTIPQNVSASDSSITLKVGTPGLVEGTNYWVWFQGPIKDLKKTEFQGNRNFPAGPGGIITIQNVNGIGNVNQSPTEFTNFRAGTYNVKVTNTDNSNLVTYCQASFPVGGACQIAIISKRTSDTPLILKVESLKANPDDVKQVNIKRKPQNNEVYVHDQKVSVLTSGLDIGKLEAGQYDVEIKNPAFLGAFGNDQQCLGQFEVYVPGTEPLNPDQNITVNATPEAFLPKVCNEKGCSTALGDISTDPAGFVSRLFAILLSLAGGIAIILIILSGYRLMSSGGNPEKVTAARDQLTSAIVGLLFVIFSLSILQIIGVDILRIPGLK